MCSDIPRQGGTFLASMVYPANAISRNGIMKKREPFPDDMLDREKRAVEAINAAQIAQWSCADRSSQGGGKASRRWRMPRG
jgi:hypothetical protein